VANHTWGYTSAPAGVYAYWDDYAEEYWAGDQYGMGNTPVEMWVESIHFFGGTTNSHPSGGNARAGLYASDVLVGGATESTFVPADRGNRALPYNLNSSTNNGGGTSPYLHLPGGWGVWVGIWSSLGLTIWQVQNGGFVWRKTGGSDLYGAIGTHENNPWGAGSLQCYLAYWSRIDVSWVTSTPVGIGQAFQIGGSGFSVGLNGITINGTAVTSYSVATDSLINATVPTGATSGAVVVDSKAGTDTAPTALQIAASRVSRASVWQIGVGGAGVGRSGVWSPSGQNAVGRSGAWVPGQ
jgi:hypothetical protein